MHRTGSGCWDFSRNCQASATSRSCSSHMISDRSRESRTGSSCSIAGRSSNPGRPAQVLGNPSHPYTQLLVRSAPSLLRAGADREDRRRRHAALAAAQH
ncbi:hypothetical protein [Caballeronia sp. LZ001]|uniref:ABC transporter ATP-binding protein n=1 Tax=Caballeronia sp. LZ001 TaxID=3038553 RepID=UPI0038D3573D